VSRSASLTLIPAAAAVLSSVQCNPASVPSGGTTSCSVSLSAPAAATLTVALSDNSNSLATPASVTVPAGSQTASFTATASTVSTAQTAVVTAALSGVSKTVSLAITVSGTSNGLAAWWKLDETAGSVVADASGNGNTGAAVNNPVWTSGLANGALQVDSSNYVRVPHSASLSIKGSAISVGAWYYHTTTAHGFLLGKTVNAYTYMMYVDQISQQFVFDLTTGGVRRTLRFPGSVLGGLNKYNNTWVHLFFTYDGAAIRAYVNGVLASTLAATGPVLDNTDPFAIGARGGDGSWTRFKGKIDDVRIYDRALSAQEVQTLYSGPGQP
jgi:hypothetical protein